MRQIWCHKLGQKIWLKSDFDSIRFDCLQGWSNRLSLVICYPIRNLFLLSFYFVGCMCSDSNQISSLRALLTFILYFSSKFNQRLLLENEQQFSSFRKLYSIVLLGVVKTIPRKSREMVCHCNWTNITLYLRNEQTFSTCTKT